MAKVNKPTENRIKSRPALTPEGRENQVIAKAIDLAEKQIEDGTASSQIITHYLKLAAEKERHALELEKLEEENKLLRAKTDALQSQKRVEELYADAIKAMQIYGGRESEEYEEDEYDEY